MKYNIWDKEKIPLTDCLDFIVDNRGKTVPITDNGIKLIATNCILNNSLYPVYEKIRYVSQDTYDNWFRAHPLPGDIIFVNKGTPGKVCLVPEKIDFCFAQDMMAFRVKKEIYNKYLFAILRSSKIQNQISNSTVGTLIPHFKKEQLKDIYVPVVNYNLQKKIGDIYFKICQKIELNKEINNKLHELVNLIYLEYVSSLDENNSSRIEIKNIAKCILGGTPSRAISEYWNGNINWINSGEINKFRIIEASEYITDLGLSKSSTTLLPKETTVLAITGATLGQVSRLEIESCANQSVIGIVPNDSRFNNYIYLTMLNNIDDLALRQTGGAQQHINKNDVETFEVVVPNNIEKFDNKVIQIFKKISMNCFQNRTLEQLRDTLLPKLMSGEIDLDNIEI